MSEAHSTAKCFFLLPFMEKSHALLERLVRLDMKFNAVGAVEVHEPL